MIKDIRMVHSDGDYLLLETESGEKYRLLIDETTRQALKREAPLRLDASTLSPRDIQEAIRSGKSSEQIIAETGENADYVNKFAAPVLDELAWVLENAKAVRLVVAEDKFHDPTYAAFGEIIAERLHNRGAANVVWNNRRTETNQWLVSVSFEIGGQGQVASWIFDSGQANLEPQNPTAIDLSANRGEPAPASRIQAKAETAATKKDPAPKEKQQESVAPVLNFSPETAMPDVEPSGGLVDEIKRRREMSIAAAAEDLQPIDETQELPSIEVDEEPIVADSDETAEVFTEQPATTKKGRASIPSWDEIVFGTKTDEPEDF